MPEQPRSERKTQSRVIALFTDQSRPAKLGLEQALFENVTGALTRLFELNPSKQRLDSVHIFSNMAHLG